VQDKSLILQKKPFQLSVETTQWNMFHWRIGNKSDAHYKRNGSLTIFAKSFYPKLKPIIFLKLYKVTLKYSHFLIN